MNKEEILKLSQLENKGKPDERELNAIGKASKLGMTIGGVCCLIIILVCEFILVRPELAMAAGVIYFAMACGKDFILYSQLKNRKNLIWGIVDILLVIASAIVMIIAIMR